MYDQELLVRDYSAKHIQDTICVLIINALIQEIKLNNYVYNDKTQSIDFSINMNSIKINICIIYSEVDNMISISAVYTFSNKVINEYELASIITKYNSSSEYTPLSKVKVNKDLNVIVFETQYICKSVLSFDKENFMTYFSATVLSAEKIIKEIEVLF